MIKKTFKMRNKLLSLTAGLAVSGILVFGGYEYAGQQKELDEALSLIQSHESSIISQEEIIAKLEATEERLEEEVSGKTESEKALTEEKSKLESDVKTLREKLNSKTAEAEKLRQQKNALQAEANVKK